MSEESTPFPAEYLRWLDDVGLIGFLEPDGVRIEGIELSNQDFREASSLFFTSVQLDSPLFDRGTFGKFHASQTNLRKASFFKCIQMGEVVLTDVSFFESSFLRASLSKSKISNVKFVGCDLTKTSFTQARLQDVVFIGCRFDRTFFSEAVIERVTVTEPVVEGPTFVGDIATIGQPDTHPFEVLATEPQI